MAVAEIRPLTLRAERATVKESVSKRLPIAHVLVDTPAIHLEPFLDYSVPASLDGTITTGSLVEVPYGNSQVMGLVVSRSDASVITGKIKQISKVLSPVVVSSTAHIEFIKKVSQSYGCRPWDLVRSAIPTPIAIATKKFLATQPENLQESGSDADVKYADSQLPDDLSGWLSTQKISGVIQLPISRPYWETVCDIVLRRIEVSQVLLVVPDERDVRIFEKMFADRQSQVITLTSSQKKSERFFNYLSLISAKTRITISTRSGVLAALPDGASIIVLDDVDPSHYEQKSPSWNTREIALARRETHSVVFLSLAPSYELLSLSRLNQTALYRFPKSDPLALSFSEDARASIVHQGVGKALGKGSVLFRTPSSGYITSFSCHKCRNIAYCECGGKLYYRSGASDPRCHICDRVYLDWRCAFCGEQRSRIARAGAERLAAEYARSFAGVSVLYSQGNHPIDFLPEGKHLVLATAGVEPIARYQGIALMDLATSLSHTSMRSQELVRLQTLRAISQLTQGGVVICGLAENHPFAQELLRRSFLESSLADIEQRTEVNLPPASKVIICQGEDLRPLINALKPFTEENSSSSYCEILGPMPDGAKSRVIVKVSLDKAMEVIARLYEVNRVLSLHKQELVTYHIDPYDI